MKPCKRLEIIIEHGLADKVAASLAALNVSGYSLIPSVSGKGSRGERLDDDPAGTFTNCMFIVACDKDGEAERIVEEVRPLLTRSGGICLVTDALSVIH